jgi:hypothetical protein
MKVKVNYTIELDKIPELIQDILSTLKSSLTECESRLVFNPNNFNKMVENFESAREKLGVVDAQIEDVLSITSGWLQATQSKDAETDNNQESDDADNQD